MHTLAHILPNPNLALPQLPLLWRGQGRGQKLLITFYKIIYKCNIFGTIIAERERA